ncbi:hypothetical protein IAE60_15060 [Pseudoxanthomonas mexicana]|uniref:Uncharacterized protein n=1 Tax=Pseudoxanthomonas mexicana TaxID=128785 RepID=A0A7G9TAV3_PSEMX|nr:hypothetical protein [Pseudoxanthomonas mexicana]QNN77228.1 hypothetical protein IAE60_15060 [Pseudoxanthomonas mexicana]
MPTLNEIRARNKRADFSGVTARVDSTETIVQPKRMTLADVRKRSQPAQPQVKEGNAVGRFLGEIGGRETMQAAYGLYGMLGGDALNEYVFSPLDRAIGWGDQLGIGNRTYRDAAAAQADEWGMRRPQTATQRVVADIGEGLAGTGLTMGIGGLVARGAQGAQTFGNAVRSKLGDFLTAQPALQTASTVTGVGAASGTREAGGGTSLQVLAGLAGGMAPTAPALAAATTRAAVRAPSIAEVRAQGLGPAIAARREAMGQTIDDFASVGATPSVGQASGSRMAQEAEALLGNFSPSSGVVERFAAKQGEDIGAGMRNRAEELYRNASGQRAGTRIVKGAQTFKEESKKRVDELYRKLDEQIPQDTRIGVDNVRAELEALNAGIPGAPTLSQLFRNGRLTGIEDALQRDTLGVEGAMSRPDVRAGADALRNDLTDAANYRRAELAQESQQYRQQLLGEADARRQQLTQEADALRQRLTTEAQAIARENERMRLLGLRDFRKVPTQAEIDAQVPTAQQIERQVMQEDEITRRVTPESAYRDPQFGQSYVDQQVDDYLAGRADGKLPYEAVQKLRTLVGNELDGSSLLSDVPRSKWSLVYKALTKDMEAAASTPEQRRALNRANAYYKARIDRLELLDSVIRKNGGPEKVYRSVMQGSYDGGTILRTVMRSLPQEGRRALTAAVIRRMGLAKPGRQNAAGDRFSVDTFLTNWGNVSPQAKSALFDSYGSGFRRDMDRIARVAETIKEGKGVLANPSGTARLGTAVGYWLGLMGAAVTGNFTTAGGLASLGVASNVAARAMTNPRFVKWLANTTAMPRGALPAQLQALKTIADREKDPELQEIARELEQASNR